MCDDKTGYDDRPVRGGASAARGPQTGFTLIEVLIALAIVAVALGAVMRAIGALASDTDTARMRLLALWSADNALGAIRIAASWPPVGASTFACPQGPYRFVCRQSVTALPSPLVRQVTVSVHASASSRTVLAEVVTVVHDEARR
ncbi:type II secretion system minor pseudopilin GspI [Burkholderia ubonensis]|uniref:type II secretion system minor pseudopilin GspI n=1 Tax=Burkholderia ubonensis TaxID=101571 RepID=UPI00075EEE5C|nr:type II secretion system minor pseudopilin GspI [Burkholderia ubonensis]AOK63350.1 type II secretion system protein GspI [Burkholderia ubonensis]KVS40811.1 type II secretion system protein GspI [Burkholderia ubonensis]KVS51430.1 type II secretion system protein GspI [Burkholderia ubonensis]KVS76434.1 type II secretion system protein GspI [Burkholderia ubonensis]KVS78672.1 type II secretion system protein GspI [Burkholderia ubonensis]